MLRFTGSGYIPYNIYTPFPIKQNKIEISIFQELKVLLNSQMLF